MFTWGFLRCFFVVIAQNRLITAGFLSTAALGFADMGAPLALKGKRGVWGLVLLTPCNYSFIFLISFLIYYLEYLLSPQSTEHPPTAPQNLAAAGGNCHYLSPAWQLPDHA